MAGPAELAGLLSGGQSMSYAIDTGCTRASYRTFSWLQDAVSRIGAFGSLST